ncbi:fasciclin-1-like [Pomacea canaliculata]|uniref:fasciclin-1-like n=1 Tax=Pomacea canaliculata TaxID=400727 RepID=UPI000D735C41|nr:fasciclin-1-like [Pomacea canaliculata]
MRPTSQHSHSLELLETTTFSEQRPEMSRSAYQTKIFFNIRSRREGDVSSGTAGPTEYYANGALILRPNIPAGRSMIHVVDRVLELPSQYGIKGFISLKEQPDTAFYNNVVMFLPAEYWNDVVEPLNSNERVTVFVPTKEAIARIPSDKLQQLRGSSQLLRDVIKRHIIPDQIMYTSFVYHNEGVNTLYGQLIYRISSERETVFVSSGAVTAQVVHGNITAKNGVVHFVDSLLGYVYNTALDEIRLTSFATTFENVLIKSRNDLQNAIVLPNGVTVFVPINQAFSNLPSMYNFQTNQSLINMVMELCMLQQGMEFQLTSVNGDYEARRTLLSRYFNRPVNVYSQGNETWVESGYVKAKVVRPDVGVTNGFIHFIDGVPGLPSRSIPDTIFCEDWLIKSHIQLQMTGLDVYLSDPQAKAVAPCASNTGVNKYPSSSQQGAAIAPRSCGTINQRCSFTIFIPNGTAIDFFENQPYGKQIQNDARRWQWVLRRHITRQIIYIDQTALTQEREFTSDNGDVVRYKRSTDRYAYLYYRGRQARILHSDLGATNGVVHIIDRVIFVQEDVYATTSEAHIFSSSTIMCTLCILGLHVIYFFL